MLSKNTLKFIKSLQLKKSRDEEGLFIVEGKKSVIELLGSDFQIESVYCTDQYLPEIEVKRLNSVPVVVLSQSELESISRLDSNNSMLAIAKMKPKLDFFFENIDKLLILDQIQDPGNLGTIIRTADWFGINTIICSENTVDFYNPKVITATMGSFTRVNLSYMNLTESIGILKGNNFKIYGALLNGMELNSIASLQKYALVIGNESKGISSPIQDLIDQSVTIQGSGKAESLNASIAAAIIMHHFSKLQS